MKFSIPLRYTLVFLLPLSVGIGFSLSGIWSWLPVVFSFGIVPLIEFLVPPNPRNFSEPTKSELAHKPIFDVLLWAVSIVHWVFVFWFLWIMANKSATLSTQIGWAVSLGLMCGVIGINVAHELGHRPQKQHQVLAKILLLSSLYMHFFIEHNRGHHKYVGTPEDPASARFNEPLQFFWVRSVWFSYLSAWQLEHDRLKRKKLPLFSWKNEMVRFTAVQSGFLVLVFFLFGMGPLLWFLAAAAVGILLLETVNYIEHYGLVRKKISPYRYEDAAPRHSWNSNHLIGRFLLFELSRHSDHHYQPSKKYILLDNHEESPQLPTGYPGMMLLALVPPLWFRIMNRRVKIYMPQKIGEG